jgi:hypothetical protein
MQDAGCRMQDVQSRAPDVATRRAQAAGCKMYGARCNLTLSAAEAFAFFGYVHRIVALPTIEAIADTTGAPAPDHR